MARSVLRRPSRRAVAEAAEHLAAQGAELCPWVPPDIPEALDIYYQLVGADGGMDVTRLLKNSRLHPHLRRLVQGARLSKPMRWMVSTWLHCRGQKTMAHLLQQTRRSSVIDYWSNTRWLVAYRRRLLEIFREQGFQAALCPPHALPAMPHGAPIDLLPAASYSFLPNLLGWPAGVVAASRVREGEDQQREVSRDRVLQRARETDADSVGLPVGVQVLAPALARRCRAGGDGSTGSQFPRNGRLSSIATADSLCPGRACCGLGFLGRLADISS